MIHEWYHSQMVNNLGRLSKITLQSKRTYCIYFLSTHRIYVFPLSTCVQFLILRCPGWNMALGNYLQLFGGVTFPTNYFSPQLVDGYQQLYMKQSPLINFT